MKKAVWIILTLVTQVIIIPAYAQEKLEFSGDCTYPEKPVGVDGSTATEAQMITFQKDTKEFQAKGKIFLECLDKEEGQISSRADAEQKEEFKAKVTQSYNAVVDEMNVSAEQFNAALKAYKSQSK